LALRGSPQSATVGCERIRMLRPGVFGSHARLTAVGSVIACIKTRWGTIDRAAGR